MSEARRIRDVMVPIAAYPSVSDRTTLAEAVEVMENAELEVERRRSLPRCLLVFDAIGVLVGYIRRRDIMRGLEPKFLVSKPLDYRRKVFDVDVDPNLSEMTYDRVIQGIRDQGSRPVSDVMRPIEAILWADDHVMKAVYEMVALDLSLIPVLDGRELVGVIRSVDALHELARTLR